MMKTLPDKNEMERATLTRDESYDGVFFVGVRSTGIFCRPSCPAKKPQGRNMMYYATVRDCLLAGFRPCKRCRPLATNGQTPAWLGQVVAQVEGSSAERITDADLRNMGIDPDRARRYFKRRFGMTFQGYHRARRMGLALQELRSGGDALMVGLGAGYDSSSGFRDAFEKTFGTTPGRAYDVLAIHTATLESPIGPLIAGATDQGVCLLEFADRRALQRQVETLKRRTGGFVVPGRHENLDHLATELTEYFDGKRQSFTVPLVSPGTTFQRHVWAELRNIPYGTTRSYDQLARAIGRPGAHRAVARANGDNRLAILIPCHRVVKADGTLSGYGGGVWRKQYLIDLEHSTKLDRAPRAV